MLAAEEFDLALGEDRTLVLTLADAPPGRPKVEFSGLLSFPAFPMESHPAFPMESQVVLRLYDSATYDQSVSYGDEGPATRAIPIAAMEPRAGPLPTFAFTARDLPCGRWQAKLWPFLVSRPVDLPPEGLTDWTWTIPELAEVEVEVRDAGRQELLPLEEISWSRFGVNDGFAGMVNFLGETVPWNEAPGHFRFYTPPGEVDVYAESPHHASTRLSVALSAGRNRLTLNLNPRCALYIFLKDGEAVLHREDPLYQRVRVHQLDGDGTVTSNALSTESRVELSGPGLYEVALEGAPDERYFLPQPLRVEARPGVRTEVEFRLQRR